MRVLVTSIKIRHGNKFTKLQLELNGPAWKENVRIMTVIVVKICLNRKKIAKNYLPGRYLCLSKKLFANLYTYLPYFLFPIISFQCNYMYYYITNTKFEIRNSSKLGIIL